MKTHSSARPIGRRALYVIDFSEMNPKTKSTAPRLFKGESDLSQVSACLDKTCVIFHFRLVNLIYILRK